MDNITAGSTCYVSGNPTEVRNDTVMFLRLGRNIGSYRGSTPQQWGFYAVTFSWVETFDLMILIQRID